jgi:hypothetical protein
VECGLQRLCGQRIVPQQDNVEVLGNVLAEKADRAFMLMSILLNDEQS